METYGDLPPVEDTADNWTATLGADGSRRWGGIIAEEVDRRLQGQAGRDLYNSVAKTPIPAAFITAVELYLRRAEWHVRPANDTPAAVEVAEYVDSCLDDMEESWASAVSAMVPIVFGFSVSEIILKVRNGPQPGIDPDTGQPFPVSKFDDRKLGVAELAPRLQRSIILWIYGPANTKGGQKVIGFRQVDYPTGRTLDVPLAKCLHVRASAKSANPESESFLRPAVFSWLNQQQLGMLEMINFERDVTGVPVIEVDVEDLPKVKQQQEVAMAQSIVRHLRNNEATAVTLPGTVTSGENSHKRFNLYLLPNPGGDKAGDIRAGITALDQRIAISLLVGFLLLGHEGVSSIGGNKGTEGAEQMFQQRLDAMLDMIKSEVNRKLVATLVRLNGWTADLCPTLEHGPIEDVSIKEISEFVRTIAQAGVDVTSPEIREKLLTLAGLPVTDIDQLSS